MPGTRNVTFPFLSAATSTLFASLVVLPLGK